MEFLIDLLTEEPNAPLLRQGNQGYCHSTRMSSLEAWEAFGMKLEWSDFLSSREDEISNCFYKGL